MEIVLPHATPHFAPPSPSSEATNARAADSSPPPQQLQRLFRMLRRMAGREETLSFGGIQHLLNRHQQEEQQQQRAAAQEARHDGQETPRLPDSVLLDVFSHLSADELGRVAPVCAQWERVASDELLWRCLLRRDQARWESLSHEANPDLFEATAADLGSKERYLRCSPRFRASQRRLGPHPGLLPALLRWAWPRRAPGPPKLAVLGPGLDAGCSGIARRFIADPQGRVTVGRPFPGSHGMGAGFEYSVDGLQLGLAFLYSAPRAEREAEGRSRLFQAGEGPGAPLRLSHGFRELCTGLDGLVFVLDAAAPLSAARAEVARAELSALGEHCWALQAGRRAPVPLLVLALVNKEATPARVACLDAVRLLDLNAVRLPWRVYAGCVETGRGLDDGLHWIVHEISDGAAAD